MKQKIIILFLILTSLFCDKIISRDKEELNIALIYPKLTRNAVYYNDSTFKPTDSWELFLMSYKCKYEMLNDDELGDVKDGVNVIIIPSMEAVNEEIVENIEKLLGEGKGVLITGNFAQYDEEGNYISSDFQKRVIGFQISRLNGDNGISVNHSLNGNDPLTAGFDPGQKILLNRKPFLYYSLDLSGENNALGSYLQEGNEHPGIVNFMPSDKRLLWYGFNLDQLIGKDRDRFILNSLKWLSFIPQAFINYWPSDYSSAAALYKNIQNSFDIDDTFNSAAGSYKINYFVVPQILEKSDSYLNNLNNPGNINLLWDDFYFSCFDSGELSEWLLGTKTAIMKYTDQNYCGVSSFGEFYDSSTYKLLNRTGYSFIFSAGYSADFSISYDSTYKLYLFTQTDSPGADYKSRLNFILDAGGLGYINIDSLQEDIFNLLNDKKCWVTTFADILDWTAKRNQLGLTIDNTKNNYYEIRIENNTSAVLQNTVIWISIPDITGKAVTEPYRDTGRLTFDSKKKMYYLEIPSLHGFQKMTFRVSVPI